MKKNIFIVIMIFCMIPAFSQQGLVGYWSFDTLRGQVFEDSSAYDNHGINSGGALVPGIKNKALAFDGNGDFAEISDSAGTPAVLQDLDVGTLSLWFKIDNIPTDYGIAPIFYYGMKDTCDFFDAANEGLIVEVGHSPIYQGSERIFFTLWKNGCTYPSFCFDSGEPIPENQWHHYVVVVGENSNTGYLNGRELVDRRYNFGTSSYSQFFADAVSHKKLWLGKGHWDRTVQYYDGAIDELKIFDQALSGSEVKQLYEDQTPVSREDIPAQKDAFQLHPNPASHVVYYNVPDTKQERVEAVFINTQDQMVYSKQNLSPQGQLQVDHLAPGLYFLMIQGSQESFTKPVMIAR